MCLIWIAKTFFLRNEICLYFSDCMEPILEKMENYCCRRSDLVWFGCCRSFWGYPSRPVWLVFSSLNVVCLINLKGVVWMCWNRKAGHPYPVGKWGRRMIKERFSAQGKCMEKPIFTEEILLPLVILGAISPRRKPIHLSFIMTCDQILWELDLLMKESPLIQGGLGTSNFPFVYFLLKS